MNNFVTLTDEQYAALAPIEKAQYKRAYNKAHGIKSENKRISINVYRNAIRDNCLYCCNDSRHDVKHCAITKCPLHTLRPFQGTSDMPDDVLDDNASEDFEDE